MFACADIHLIGLWGVKGQLMKKVQNVLTACITVAEKWRKNMDEQIVDTREVEEHECTCGNWQNHITGNCNNQVEVKGEKCWRCTQNCH